MNVIQTPWMAILVVVVVLSCQRRTALAFTPAPTRRPTVAATTLHMVMDDFLITDNDDGGDGENNPNTWSGDGDGQEEISDEELLALHDEWDERIARYNTVHLTGRIGNDPEPRYFDDGKVVVNLSLASRRKYHSLERVAENIQSWQDEETEWYGLEIWGTTAEFAANYIDKGTRVGVIGSLQVDSWTDRETGEPRQRAKILVRDLDVLETRAESEARRRQSGGGAGGGGNRSTYGSSNNYSSSGNNNNRNDDEGGFGSGGSGGFFG